MEKVPEIVLTGGPCAGKTTGLAYLSEKLQDRGFRVFLVPEIATIFISSGIQDISEIARDCPEKYFAIEKQMLLGHLDLRRSFGRLATLFPEEKRVIICDRGAMDVKAYVPEEWFAAILEDCRLTTLDVCESYKAVIHLVTAAKGAEQFYTKENNPARRESLEEARLADERTRDAWIGHSHLKIIDNSTGFELKLKRLLAAASRALDIPVPLEIERKFLLAEMPDFQDPLFGKVQKVEIEQMYLISTENENETVRIRKRSRGNHSVYYKTVKTDIASFGRAAKVRRETENIITAADYLHFRTFKDPETEVIRKNRYCFAYNSQYFELDIFLEPRHLKGLMLLEIELTEENDRFGLPPFLSVIREVTDDPDFTNFVLAQKI